MHAGLEVHANDQECVCASQYFENMVALMANGLMRNHCVPRYHTLHTLADKDSVPDSRNCVRMTCKACRTSSLPCVSWRHITSHSCRPLEALSYSKRHSVTQTTVNGHTHCLPDVAEEVRQVGARCIAKKANEALPCGGGTPTRAGA